MYKNVASQKITLLAIDTVNNVPKTGDSANITAYVSKDDGAVTVLGDTSATEVDATNAPGLYVFDLTQSETNADKLIFSGKSTTSGVRVVPQTITPLPANFTALSIDTNGRLDLAKWGGTAVASANVLTAAAVQSIWDALTSALTTANSIGKRLADNVDATISSRLAGASYSAPPSAASIAAAVWDALTSAAATAGSFGVLAKTYIDATISSRSSHTAADVWASGTRTLTSFGTLVSDVATAVWAAGTRTLTSFGTLAADVWAVATSGLTTAGTIGKRVVDYLDAAVSSRLASGSYTAPDNAGISSAAASAASAATSAASAATSAASADSKATTILGRLGAWAGSGANTILGAFKAIASKTATLPSDLSAGGSDFDNTTDALQAIRDRGDVAWITGGGGGGGQLVVNVVPSVTGVGDVSSDTITAYVSGAGNATIVCVDSEGSSVTLPDPVTFCVETRPGRADLFSNSPVVSTNQAAVTWTAADVPAVGDYFYSLRNPSTGRVYAEGVFRVKYAALAD